MNIFECISFLFMTITYIFFSSLIKKNKSFIYFFVAISFTYLTTTATILESFIFYRMFNYIEHFSWLISSILFFISVLTLNPKELNNDDNNN